MKNKNILITLVILMASIAFTLGQTIEPQIQFNENPKTHNMHICSDGKFFYTVNGGKSNEGQIGKFSLKGDFITNYPIELDMRGIIYHKKEKCFYVNCYDRSVYRITELESGTYTEVFSEILENEQSCIATDHKNKYLYALNFGILYVYDFKSGKALETIDGFKCGNDFITGGASVAVDKKNIYTFDSDKMEIYVYDLKSKNLKETKKIAKGDYGFSISTAKKYVFVSKDGDYSTGTWYGYKF